MNDVLFYAGIYLLVGVAMSVLLTYNETKEVNWKTEKLDYLILWPIYFIILIGTLLQVLIFLCRDK